MAGVNLAQGTWEEAEALVGTRISTIEGVDLVAASDFRRQLEVLGWDCPLHTDDAFARAHGYDGVVSPATMTRIFALPSYWRPGEPRVGEEVLSTPLAISAVPGEGDEAIATKIRQEYFAPIHPGDRITATAVLRGVTRKDTKVGPGAFLVIETTYTNQRGETVALETATVLRYAPLSKGNAR